MAASLRTDLLVITIGNIATVSCPPVKFNVIDSISIWYDLGNAMY